MTIIFNTDYKVNYLNKVKELTDVIDMGFHDNINQKESEFHNHKEDESDDLNHYYREDFLAIFGLDDYDDDAINHKIEEIYNILITDPLVQEIVDYICEYTLCTDDKLIAFMFLFSYELLQYSHSFLSHILISKTKQLDIKEATESQMEKYENKEIYYEPLKKAVMDIK
jgi:hypothetical protein